MDHTRTPFLDAVDRYHRDNRYGFTPPGHRQGRGVDARVTGILGMDPFRCDLLASGGLDDRKSSGHYLAQAEELMADAVGASSAFFSTCGSSLSVKAAMMAVAGGCEGGLLVGRDSHKIDHRGLDLLRRAAALDDAAMGCPAAYLPSALSAPGRGGMAAAPGCGRRLDRQPQPLWHLCGYRGHCAGMSSSR